MNSKLISKLDSYTVTAQTQLMNRLKLYDFAKTAIKHYSKYKNSDLSVYDFTEFKRHFKLITFKHGKEIKSISYKHIVQVGDSFINNELSDSIFVLNMSTFEHWVLTTLKLGFLERPEELFGKGSTKEVSLDIILEVKNLDELWERIIDNYLVKIPYTGIKKMLELFISKFKCDKSKFTPDIIDRINENSLCRNLIVHNQKKVSELYIRSCGKQAKFKEGEFVVINEDILFEQGDNLLRFMQDFRKRISH